MENDTVILLMILLAALLMVVHYSVGLYFLQKQVECNAKSINLISDVVQEMLTDLIDQGREDENEQE